MNGLSVSPVPDPEEPLELPDGDPAESAAAAAAAASRGGQYLQPHYTKNPRSLSCKFSDQEP